MGYECKGVIHFIGEVEEVGQNGFKKRVLVLNTEGEYPKYPVFEFVQAKTAELDYVKVGQQANVSFNLEGSGKEYNGRYYGSLRGWKIQSSNETAAPAAPTSAAPDPLADEPAAAPESKAAKATEPKAAPKKAAPAAPAAIDGLDDDDDDLPF